MTIRDQIIDYLRTHPEWIDDDALASALELKQRQQANSRCRQLEAEKLVERRQLNGKIHNIWVGSIEVNLPEPTPTEIPFKENGSLITKPWFWEGNVQNAVIEYLKETGFRIVSSANTASHERGKDIVASKEGKELWITVKGYPNGTLKTRATTQSGHWFKQAIFDILQYRGEKKEVNLGVALPDYKKYRTLGTKICWLKPIAGFSYYWVDESGVVTRE